MKYLCLERCYDSSKCRGYYEDEIYDLSKAEVKHLEKIGTIKYFKELSVEAVPEEKPEQPDQADEKPKTKAKG